MRTVKLGLILAASIVLAILLLGLFHAIIGLVFWAAWGLIKLLALLVIALIIFGVLRFVVFKKKF